MKVSFVIPYFFPAWQYGGQPRSAFELARGLVRRGHSVQVLTTDSGGGQRIAGIERTNMTRNVEGIEVIYYPNVSNTLAYRHRIFWAPAFFRAVREQLSRRDIVHIHELRSTTSVAAHRAAMKTGIPYVISAHGGLRHLGKRPAKMTFDALWGRRIMRDAAGIVVVSPAEAHDAQMFGVESRRIRRLPNAIDIDDYRNLPPRGAFRSRWSIGPEKIVLFFGRLHWIKGADLLLDAFQEARLAEKNIRLVIAGPDDGQAAELRRRVREKHLNEHVTFTGFLDGTEKLEALTGSDVLVLPSRNEAFALSAIESLVCGTPVIVSSACGLYPLPAPDLGVVQFESENVRDLAGKLLTMVGSESFPHNGPAARNFVLNEFSSRTIAAKAERIYDEILHRAGQGPD